MSMSKRILHVPYGTADILPGEAAARRNIKNSIGDIFSAWGYEEVETPVFEYVSTFSGGGRISDSNFKFFDRRNNILMLRTDMTAPIARLVATRLKEEAGIKRLSYQAELFRYEEAQEGRQCQFTQAGIEMMGASGAAADAEVVALAVKALLEAGLEDFTISIGQVAFINGLAAAAGFNEEETLLFRHCLITHNAVGLEELVEARKLTGALAEVVKNALFLHGNVAILDEISSKLANKDCKAALTSLKEMYALAKAYGVEKYLSFDLGLLRDFDYYTGMIFEGYAPGIGYPILGGGRYDNMMAAFGRPCPAIGFALGIDRIVLALSSAGKFNINRACDLLVTYKEGKLKEAIKACVDLREQGQSVKLAERPSKEAEGKDLMVAANCCAYTYIE
jgi:ATP phosphoribosyltransferase regulatory subunit